MFDTKDVLIKARTSSFYKRVLNWSLNRMIPFNAPHGFEIFDSGQFHVKVRIPYKRRNLNHIKGLHACALATASEFATGFLLINNLDAKKYRLIMQRLEMDYHYQGKMDSFATFDFTPAWLDEKIILPLEATEAVVVTCVVKIHDAKGNHLTTGNVHWQIKAWSRVKTKL